MLRAERHEGFSFEPSHFALRKWNFDGLETRTRNWVVGGESRWAYASFDGYAFLPHRRVPMLLCFREKQTGVDADGRGQLHLCPLLADRDEMERRFAEHRVPAL